MNQKKVIGLFLGIMAGSGTVLGLAFTWRGQYLKSVGMIGFLLFQLYIVEPLARAYVEGLEFVEYIEEKENEARGSGS